MKGGGGNKDKEQAAPAAPAHQLQQSTYQPTMPQAQGLLAQQLSAGYGTPVEENLGLLNAMYQPMQTTTVNGAADMNALRAQLDAAGIKLPK